MAAPIVQLRIFHRSFSRTAKDCTRTGKNLRNFRNLGKSLAVLGILELSCQGLGILELSWQGLKSTAVSVRVMLKENRKGRMNSLGNCFLNFENMALISQVEFFRKNFGTFYFWRNVSPRSIKSYG